MYQYRSFHKKSVFAKIFQITARIFGLLLGGVFIFSGFVKAIDPLGFAYKIQDYLTAFGPLFERFSVLALPTSIALSSLELIVGLLLFFNLFVKGASSLALLFMCVMLPFTFYVAQTNPVTDCGCFGDAVIIDNWTTFYKNIVLTILAIVVFSYRKKFRSILVKPVRRVLLVLFLSGSVGLSIYCYLYLPMIDFRPYKIGVNIAESKAIPKGEQGDVYETLLIYEKDGIQQEFTIKNYPKDDSTWVFVDQKVNLISKGYEPPIHDFNIIDQFGDDILDDILVSYKKIYLLVMYDLNKASEKGAVGAENNYYKKALSENGSIFIALTGSGENDIHDFRKKTGVSFPVYFCDPTVLKTIIRSNPGLLIIENKIITAKIPWRKFNS
ncbi:MAG: DoxX family protein [Prevotellaceae bacterium]|jgi:uncharacterized membrane protein YphA (DoxX/SURF4 family)|nr:DoxX family protein [Prevotellaceae bacterium]